VSDSVFIRSFVCILLLCCAPGLASATEIRFEIAEFGSSGRSDLRAASVLLETARNEDATPQDLMAAARAEYARQVGALYQRGFYSSVVNVFVDGREAANISPLATPQRIDEIVVRIDPGPPFVFGTARVAPIDRKTTLPEGFTTGARAHSSLVGEAATAGIDRWRNLGYAKAAVADENIVADHRNATLSADIRLRTGPKLSFGELNVSGAQSVRPDRIRAIAGLPTGETFSPEDPERATSRLRRTGAFRSVAMEEAEEIGPDDTLDITAMLVEERPRRAGVGAEIASREGVTLSTFWMHRNLFGGAERLRFDLEASGIGGESSGVDYSATARFDRPATFNADTGLFLAASFEQRDRRNVKERSYRLGGGFTYVFSNRLTGELGLAYQYSELDDAFGKRTLKHLLLPGRLTFDDRDDPLDAKEGIYLDFSAIPFHELENDATGARIFLDARAYHGFGGQDRFVVAGRAQVGSIIGVDAREVSSDMLFFSGGAGTVRGQPFESLGVKRPNGDLVGGRSFLGLSAELRANVTGPWSVVAFADTGFVSGSSWGTSKGDQHSGGGFGVRYDTGIGPVRVDVATPLGSDAGEKFELYIGIGQAF